MPRRRDERATEPSGTRRRTIKCMWAAEASASEAGLRSPARRKATGDPGPLHALPLAANGSAVHTRGRTPVPGQTRGPRRQQQHHDRRHRLPCAVRWPRAVGRRVGRALIPISLASSVVNGLSGSPARPKEDSRQVPPRYSLLYRCVRRPASTCIAHSSSFEPPANGAKRPCCTLRSRQSWPSFRRGGLVPETTIEGLVWGVVLGPTSDTR